MTRIRDDRTIKGQAIVGFAAVLLAAAAVTMVLIHRPATASLPISSARQALQPLRVLPIGDSITQGGSNNKGEPEYTYRLPLQNLLTGLGIPFDFVGSRIKGLDDARWPASFDPDHDGYYGKTTAAVSKLFQPVPADIVLIHLGTNDASRWNVWKHIVEPQRAIIGRLRMQNPRVAIFIAEPSFDGVRAYLRRISLARLARELSTPESPVIFVPRPHTWNATTDTLDGVHPNARGSVKLAANWMEAVAAVIPLWPANVPDATALGTTERTIPETTGPRGTQGPEKDLP